MVSNANTVTRERVARLIANFGTQTKFIANNAGVNYVNFTLWYNGKQGFSAVNLSRINRYLDTLQNIAV